MIKYLKTFFYCISVIILLLISLESCDTQKSVMFQKGANLDSLNLQVKKSSYEL